MALNFQCSPRAGEEPTWRNWIGHSTGSTYISILLPSISTIAVFPLCSSFLHLVDLHITLRLHDAWDGEVGAGSEREDARKVWPCRDGIIGRCGEASQGEPRPNGEREMQCGAGYVIHMSKSAYWGHRGGCTLNTDREAVFRLGGRTSQKGPVARTCTTLLLTLTTPLIPSTPTPAASTAL